MENIKEWINKKGYQNSGLRIDRNHRIDLYLSDVLDEYRTELLRQQPVNSQLALDKLRQKLDEALAKETPETLIKWLEEKRQ